MAIVSLFYFLQKYYHNKCCIFLQDLLPHLTNPLYQRRNFELKQKSCSCPSWLMCAGKYLFSAFSRLHFPRCVSVKSLTNIQTTKITQNWVFSNTANNLTKMHRKTFYFSHVPDRSKMVHCCEHVSVKSLARTQKSIITFFSIGNIQDDQTHLFQLCMPVNQRKKCGTYRHFII